MAHSSCNLCVVSNGFALVLQEVLPDLYQHLQANRIETHMFASQWFLTLYTAKFPLSIVFRILDIYLCEVSHVPMAIDLVYIRLLPRRGHVMKLVQVVY